MCSFFMLVSSVTYAQVFMDADSTGDAYARILKKGYSYEVPDCIHDVRHMFEQYDSTLKKDVFVFNIHRSIDNDRCINFDRQRVEIKTWDGSPDSLKGRNGETMTHRWKFKLDAGFQPSASFTHIHQIKAGDGSVDTDNPIITFTVRKSSTNRIEINFVTPMESGGNTVRLATVNLQPFLGTWVEVYETLKYGTNGTYALVIKRVSDDSVMLNYSNNNLALWRTGITFIRPKYGIYRSLLDSNSLRDESVRFADFYIRKGATIVLPAAPTNFSPVFPAIKQFSFSWKDTVADKSVFRIERSTDGLKYYYIGSTTANVIGYTDTGLSQNTFYYYRVRAENTYGNSEYLNYTIFSGGYWSVASSWSRGKLPTAATDVVVDSGTTLIVDVADAYCKNLTINGNLSTSNTSFANLSVNGNVLINSTGSFTSPLLASGNANIFHAMSINGNFTNSGGTFNFRLGAPGTTLRAINTTFTGNINSTVTVGAYTSSNNIFNSITISKTGNAKVICGSDVVLDAGSTAGAAQLILNRGVIETGNNAINVLSPSTGDIVTPSDSSYINGALGRGMSVPGGKANFFPVGDVNGYRPISIQSTTSGNAAGHYVSVRCIHGTANTVSSSYNGGIDAVSKIRYYQVSYNKGIGSGAADMSFNKFSPSYGLDDGVKAGNTELRVAYSTDEKATWNGMSQTTPHATSFAFLPATIIPTAIPNALTLNSGSGYIYVALAKTTGSTDNTFPVALTSFASSATDNNITLQWNTGTELNSSFFEVQRMTLHANSNAANPEWNTIQRIQSAGNSSTAKNYSFVDNNLSMGSYVYRLKIIESAGTYFYSEALTTEIGIPTNFQLLQNYPNPFNPSTKIGYTLPASGHVQLQIFSITGQLIKTLVDENKDAGYYTADFISAGLSAGVYMYRISASGQNLTKKMLYLK